MPDRYSYDILHLIDGFRIGGAEVNLLEQIRELKKQGFRQAVCSFDDIGSLRPEYERLGLPLHIIKRGHRFDPRVFYQLYCIMRRDRYRLVQTALFYADVVGVITAAAAGISARISVETASHGNRFFRPLHRHVMYRLAMKFVSRIVAVSREVKQSLIAREKIPTECIEVIPNAVDMSSFDIGDADDTLKESIGITGRYPLLVTVARLDEVKGHTVLISALRLFKKKFPRFISVFIGDGPLRRRLEKEVKDAGLEEHIIFLGFRQDIAKLLPFFDIFVLPSLSEGLPNSVLEAMASGLPVVASAVGGIPEAVTDGYNGRTVPPSDPDSLAEALSGVAGDRKVCMEMGRRGKAVIAGHYSLQAQIESFIRLYESIGIVQ